MCGFCQKFIDISTCCVLRNPTISIFMYLGRHYKNFKRAATAHVTAYDACADALYVHGSAQQCVPDILSFLKLCSNHIVSKRDLSDTSLKLVIFYCFISIARAKYNPLPQQQWGMCSNNSSLYMSALFFISQCKF